MKSIDSFNSGKSYQAVREFNSGLLRDIEHNSFSTVEESLNAILPILESNTLYHESEQIIHYYFTHLKKHKAVKDGFLPVIFFLKINFTNNNYPNCTMKFLNGFADFVANNADTVLVDYIKDNYSSILESSNSFSLYQEVEGRIFTLLILLSLFQEAEALAQSKFLNDLENTKKLDNILYSLVVLAINGKITESTNIIRELRKTIPTTIQQESDLFQCCSEFLLACSSKDYDWVQELQTHFSDVLKNKVERHLIMNLIRKTFPEESKVSLFDLFK